MIKKEKLFYQCFVPDMKSWLVSKGHSILLKCKHYETNNTMWIFLFDKEGKLEKDLTEWTNSNPKLTSVVKN